MMHENDPYQLPIWHGLGETTGQQNSEQIYQSHVEPDRFLSPSQQQPQSPSGSKLVYEPGLVNRQPTEKSKLYKTEFCNKFMTTGACRYGVKCRFAHGRHELRTLIRHPLYKTTLCKTYQATGTCPYGTRCRFIHNESEQELSSVPRANYLDQPAQEPLDLGLRAESPLLQVPERNQVTTGLRRNFVSVPAGLNLLGVDDASANGGLGLGFGEDFVLDASTREMEAQFEGNRNSTSATSPLAGMKRNVTYSNFQESNMTSSSLTGLSDRYRHSSVSLSEEFANFAIQQPSSLSKLREPATLSHNSSTTKQSEIDLLTENLADLK